MLQEKGEKRMNIRLMRSSDYSAVYALWLSCSGMGLNSADDSEEGIARFLDRNPTTCFVAEEDTELVGVIMAGHDGRRGFIYHTAVSPRYRRQGIGETLVNAAMDALKECGISKAALVAFERNEAGNAFWEQMGFERRQDLIYRNRTLREMERIDT